MPVPIPVSAARKIGHRFRKSMVVILAYEQGTQLTHVATWGLLPTDKEQAADVGDRCAKLVCGDGFAARQSYEDYRHVDAGLSAARIERLVACCTAASHALRSLLAVREGMSDAALSSLAAELDDAVSQEPTRGS